MTIPFLDEVENRGIERGIERGIMQQSEKIAVKMLQAGFPFDKIQELTELTLEKIKELAKAECSVGN